MTYREACAEWDRLEVLKLAQGCGRCGRLCSCRNVYRYWLSRPRKGAS